MHVCMYVSMMPLLSPEDDLMCFAAGKEKKTSTQNWKHLIKYSTDAVLMMLLMFGSACENWVNGSKGFRV